MTKIPINVLSTKAYIIYLRKSRADSQDETVEEVLEKHETMLQELAIREFGGKIPENCIFREVVSGETIDERPEMLNVLELIADPGVEAVIVVEPQRLSRGDLEDCGRIVNAFRYSNTKVITLTMTYDLTNKMHRKFFEQELLRGNDFLEYTKEILYRGRIASVKKGNYIYTIPPFGYDRAVIDDGPSLKPNENADAVRMMFDLYVNENYSFGAIARRLETMGVPTVRGGKWQDCTVRKILTNIHYVGKVRFGETKTERTYQDGKTVKKRNVPKYSQEDVIIAKGKHTALVSEELYEAAQAKLNKTPRVKMSDKLQCELAGLFICKRCGRHMIQHKYKHARTRFDCRKGKESCGVKSVIKEDVMNALLFALEQEKLPELEVMLTSGAGNARAIQQRQLKKLTDELDALYKREKKQYELLETEFYTPEIFALRNQELRAEIDEMQAKIYAAKKEIPKNIDYGKQIIKLKRAIEALKNNELGIVEQNTLLKSIIDRIEYEYLSHEGKGKVRFRLHIKLLV